MSPAAAFFTGMGVGAGMLIGQMTWSVWRLRNGVRPRSRVHGHIILALMLIPPIVLAISMPDFKTALVAWFGFPIGMVVARAITTPVWYLAAQRIEKRLKAGA